MLASKTAAGLLALVLILACSLCRAALAVTCGSFSYSRDCEGQRTSEGICLWDGPQWPSVSGRCRLLRIPSGGGVGPATIDDEP